MGRMLRKSLVVRCEVEHLQEPPTLPHIQCSYSLPANGRPPTDAQHVRCSIPFGSVALTPWRLRAWTHQLGDAVVYVTHHYCIHRCATMSNLYVGLLNAPSDSGQAESFPRPRKITPPSICIGSPGHITFAFGLKGMPLKVKFGTAFFYDWVLGGRPSIPSCRPHSIVICASLVVINLVRICKSILSPRGWDRAIWSFLQLCC
ncbi:hypothetical protein K449DRAFT_208540 [Hypoxylon sp. EC38]|nr:hypothetical protein K449DRAFT_208540 [Hypoxylon sp. EC38]